MAEELDIALTNLLKANQELKDENRNLIENHDATLNGIFSDFIAVIDAFENAERKTQEQGLTENEDVQRTLKKMMVAKKKALAIMDKHNVSVITFPNNIAMDEYCVIVDTEPDSSRPDNEIVSIEKNGYKRGDKVLRPAEVIVIKN